MFGSIVVDAAVGPAHRLGGGARESGSHRHGKGVVSATRSSQFAGSVHQRDAIETAAGIQPPLRHVPTVRQAETVFESRRRGESRRPVADPLGRRNKLFGRQETVDNSRRNRAFATEIAFDDIVRQSGR